MSSLPLCTVYGYFKNTYLFIYLYNTHCVYIHICSVCMHSVYIYVYYIYTCICSMYCAFLILCLFLNLWPDSFRLSIHHICMIT